MLPELLRDNARSLGSRVAVACGDEEVRHDALLERVEALAGGLSAVGVGRGDTVLVLLPNSVTYVVGFLAAASVGAGAVLLDPASKEHELRHAFVDCRPRVVITDQRGLGRCHTVAAELGLVVTVIAVDAAPSGAVPMEELIARSGPAPQVAGLAEAPALFQYSSGSTGRQKRVGRTHAQCVAEARLVTETLGLTPDDRILCAVPLYHAYGFGDCFLTALGSGATLVIQPNPQPFAVKRAHMLELIERHGVTVLPLVPYMAEMLAATPGAGGLGRLRYCFTAGTALSPDIADAFADRFGVPLRQLYGCTESPSIAANLDPDPAATHASVGRPMQGVEVTLHPLEDPPDELPDDVGEVSVLSPAAASGYYGDVRGDTSTFRDGRVFPGDLGRLDGDGRLTLVGRTRLFIDVHGRKVDPFEVEDVLGLHPAVAEAVVVGATGATGGPTLKAVVVSRETVSERELVHFCRERLALYKVPQTVEFLAEIPRSPLGKVLRKELV